MFSCGLNLNFVKRHNLRHLGKYHFLPGRGAPKNCGDRILFLDQKRDQKILINEKEEITYIFQKKQNILLNISNSRERDCQRQLGLHSYIDVDFS